MNIFTKAKLVKLLNDKVQSGEIKSYHLTDIYLRLNKSKRTGFTFKLEDFTDIFLLNLIKKKTPKPQFENIETFYKKEIKRLKS